MIGLSFGTGAFVFSIHTATFFRPCVALSARIDSSTRPCCPQIAESVVGSIFAGSGIAPSSLMCPRRPLAGGAAAMIAMSGTMTIPDILLLHGRSLHGDLFLRPPLRGVRRRFHGAERDR